MNNVIEATFRGNTSDLDAAFERIRQQMVRFDTTAKSIGQGGKAMSFDAAGMVRGFDEAQARLEAFSRRLAAVQSAGAKIVINTDEIARSKAQLDALDAELDQLRSRRAQVAIDLLGGRATQDQLNTLQANIDRLDAERATVALSIEGLDQANAKLRQFQQQIAYVDSMDPEVTFRTSGFSALQSGMTEYMGDLQNRLPASAQAAVGALGRLGGASAGSAVAVAGIAAAAGVASVKVGQMAFELARAASALEQAQIRTDIMVDDPVWSGKIFQGMLDYSTQTTSSFTDITSSIARLASSGQVAERDLLPLMAALDDAASATGTNVADLSTVFGQMYNKGKIYYEELLQLSERNIPAVAILREEMGLTADEMNDMARRGELGLEAIDALARGIQDRYSGSTELIMDTLNGRIVAIKSNIELLKAATGENFVGPFTDLAGVLLDLTQISKALATGFNEWFGADREILGMSTSFREMAEGASPLAPIINATTIALDQMKDWLNIGESEMDKFKGTALTTGDAIENMSDSEVAKFLEEQAAAFEEAADATDSYVESLRSLGDTFAAQENAALGYEEAVAEMRDSIKELGKGAVDASGNLKLTDDASRELYGGLLNLAEAGRESIRALEENGVKGREAGRAMRQVRQDFIDAATSAGMSETAARQLANQLGLIPREVISRVNIVNVAQAMADAQRIAREIQGIKDKYVTVFVTESRRDTTAATRDPAYGAPGTGTKPRSGATAETQSAQFPIVNVNLNGRQLDSEVAATMAAYDRDRAIVSLMGAAF